jgi:enoyl-CoA hydratase/carnithine racemase
VFTARAHSAVEALADGVADRVVPVAELDREAARLAETIAAHGPIAIRLAKKAIDQGLDLPLDEALRLEWTLYQGTIATEDRLEGLRAFAEKRAPRFRGV